MTFYINVRLSQDEKEIKIGEIPDDESNQPGACTFFGKWCSTLDG